jgi:hypothetical protein
VKDPRGKDVAYLGWRALAAATPWPRAPRGLGERRRDRKQSCGGGGGAVRVFYWMEVVPISLCHSASVFSLTHGVS